MLSTIRLRSIIDAGFIGEVLIEMYQNTVSPVLAGFASQSNNLFGSPSSFIVHIGVTIVFALILERVWQRPVPKKLEGDPVACESIYRTNF